VPEPPRPESPILPYPCSQANPTGVHWNYDASPASKARLEALLNQSDDEDDPPTPDENVTPAFKLRLRPYSSLRSPSSTKRPQPPKIDNELLDDLEELRELWANVQANKAAKERLKKEPPPLVSTPPPPQQRKTPTRSTRTTADVFADDSADNSFLIQCTQAAETEHFKQPGSVGHQKTSKEPPAASAAAALAEFDEDEEFDFMLSQMPMDSPKAAGGVKGGISKAVTPKASAVTSASWRRAHSSPEAATTSRALVNNCKLKQRHQTESSVSGFNKLEAERRKMEAIERRENKKRAAAAAAAAAVTAASKQSAPVETTVVIPPTQKPGKVWSKEENERKRQEALRKRQQSQARKAISKRK